MPVIWTWLSKLRIAALLAGSSTSPKEIRLLNSAGFCFFFRRRNTSQGAHPSGGPFLDYSEPVEGKKNAVNAQGTPTRTRGQHELGQGICGALTLHLYTSCTNSWRNRSGETCQGDKTPLAVELIQRQAPQKEAWRASKSLETRNEGREQGGGGGCRRRQALPRQPARPKNANIESKHDAEPFTAARSPTGCGLASTGYSRRRGSDGARITPS